MLSGADEIRLSVFMVGLQGPGTVSVNGAGVCRRWGPRKLKGASAEGAGRVEGASVPPSSMLG